MWGTWQAGRRRCGHGIELQQRGEDVFGAGVEGVAGREEALGEGGGGAVGARRVTGSDALRHDRHYERPQPLRRRLTHEEPKHLRRGTAL